MKILFCAILLIGIELIPILSCEKYSATEENDSPELQRFSTQQINDFKLDFHRSFERTRIKRKKRENYLLTVANNAALVEEHLGVWNVSSVFSSETFGHESVKTWTAIEFPQETLLFWGHSNGQLTLADFQMSSSGPRLSIITQYIERGNGMPFKSNFFNYRESLWLVVAFRSKEREYLAVYQLSARNFYRKQTIETDLRSDFDIIKNKGIIYMAISSYLRKTKVGSTLQSTVKLYEWRNTQFDSVAEQRTFRATSVRLFNMAGTLYLTVSQAIEDPTFNLNNGNGNEFNSGSPVFVYNSREDEKLTYVQIIRTYSAFQVQHFRVDGNDYLVFASPFEDSRIFWWAGHEFLEFQILRESRSAISIAVSRLPNAEILLALLYNDRIKFFTESVNSQYNMTAEITLPHPGNFESIKLFSHIQQNYYALFTFADNQKSPLGYIWKLNLISYETTDHQDLDPLNACLMNLEKFLIRQEEDLRQLALKTDRIWVTNKLQSVKAPVIVKGKLHVKGKGIDSRLLLITNTTTVPQITNTQVRVRTDNLGNNLQSVVDDLKNIVLKSKNQTIYGRVTFTEPINSMNTTLGNIGNKNVFINKVSFNSLIDKTLTINSNQVISGRFAFHNDVIVNNLNVRGYINDVNMSDALLIDWPFAQQITGTHKYGEMGLQTDLHLVNQGTINGIRPSQFVTKHGNNQQISGQKTFHSLHVTKNINIKRFLNGKDLNELANRAVTLNGPNQVITGQIAFESPIQVGRIKLKGLINSVVNVSELAFNAVNVFGDQRIFGKKIFSAPVFVDRDVRIGSTVNYIKLNRDVITSTDNQVLTGKLVFKSPVRIMKDLNTKTINGIEFRNEVIRRNMPLPQNIGTKIFDKSITVLQDISMDPKSTIDGVDPSELRNLVINNNKNIILDSGATFNKLIVKGNAFAPTVNNYLINDLPHILWLKSVNQTIKVPVRFNGLLKINKIESGTTNGFKIPQDFVLKYGDNEVIDGNKIFLDPVEIIGNIDVRDGRRINNIDLSWFERNAVTKITNKTDMISGRKQFKSILVKGNVFAAKVNGIDLEKEIMLINKAQTVFGDIELRSPFTLFNGPIDVLGNIHVNGTVNNISLSRFVNEVVINSGPQSILRPIRNKIFANGIDAHVISAYGTISGINIDEMKARVVTLNDPQVIFATKNFTEVKFNNDLRSGFLNGLNINEFSKRVVRKNQKTLVRGPKSFAGRTKMERNLETTGLIYGVDVKSLQRKAMSRTRDNDVLAPIGFANDISLGELVIDSPASIDGIRPSQLVLLSEDLRFDDYILINNSIKVTGDILNTKTVNGCDLKKLAQDALHLDITRGQQIVYGMIQFLNLEVAGDVHINGPINHININELAAKIVTRSGNQEIFAPLIFENNVHVQNLFLKNLINGKNLTFILNDSVVKNKPQIISGRKAFSNALILNGSLFQVSGHVAVDGLINGVDVVRLSQTAVRKNHDEEIHGIKTFTGPVIFNQNIDIRGTINGLKIPQSLVLLDSTQLIPGRTIFEHEVIFEHDLEVKKLIDGVNIIDFIRNRVTLSHEHELITSHLNLTLPTTIKKLIVKETINGIPINAFVRRHGSFVINGEKTFANEVVITGNLGSPGLFNGINLHDLVNRAVSLLRNEMIPEITEFVGPVSMRHLLITGLLNGIDVSDMANFFQRLTKEVDLSVGMVRNQLAHQEKQLISQFNKHLHQESLGLSYFELNQELDVIGERFLLNSWPTMSSYDDNFIDSLILWSFNPEDPENCRKYLTLIFDVSEDGILRPHSSPQQGRYFPLLGNEIGDREDANLLLWTNTTGCPSIYNEGTRIQTTHTDDVNAIHSKRRIYSDNYSNAFTASPYLKDAKLFINNGEIHVVLANHYNKNSRSFHTNSSVLWYNSKTRQWLQTQRLETFGAYAIDMITIRKGNIDVSFLAVANRFNARGNDAPSFILEWIPSIQKFEVNSAIQTSNPSSVLFLQTNGQLFVVFANEKLNLLQSECGEESNHFTEPINIYRYNSKTFELIQSIDLPGVVSLASFKVANETYLIAASRYLDKTFILQFRGYNLFDVIQTIPTPGVEDIRIFWSKDSILLAIASNKSGHSKILKAVINGPNTFRKYLSVEDLMMDADSSNNKYLEHHY